MKQDKLYYCKKCELCKGVVKITRGKLYPCEERHGYFEINGYKCSQDIMIPKDYFTNSCELQKKIKSFEYIGEGCLYFLQNLINT